MREFAGGGGPPEFETVFVYLLGADRAKDALDIVAGTTCARGEAICRTEAGHNIDKSTFSHFLMQSASDWFGRSDGSSAATDEQLLVRMLHQ